MTDKKKESINAWKRRMINNEINIKNLVKKESKTIRMWHEAYVQACHEAMRIADLKVGNH